MNVFSYFVSETNMDAGSALQHIQFEMEKMTNIDI